MELFTQERKDSVRLAWLTIMEGIYAFSPRQRLVLVVGLIMIIPSYWIARVGAKVGFDQVYKNYRVVATKPFHNPQAPQVGTLVIVPASGGGYMAYAKVVNPNLRLSTNNARYTAKFTNSSGSQIYQTNGAVYLLPGKETYIVVPRFQSPEVPSSGTITFGEISWQQKTSIPEVALSAPIPLVLAEREGSRVEGVLVNSSPYKLGAARLVLLFYDRAGKVAAVSDRTELTLKPGERRAYVLRYPEFAPGDIARTVPVVLETNAADVGNVQALDEELAPQR